MKVILIILGIIALPFIIKLAIKLIGWLIPKILMLISIVFIGVGILLLINGNIIPGIICILLGGVLLTPYMIKREKDDDYWTDDRFAGD